MGRVMTADRRTWIGGNGLIFRLTGRAAHRRARARRPARARVVPGACRITAPGWTSWCCRRSSTVASRSSSSSSSSSSSGCRSSGSPGGRSISPSCAATRPSIFAKHPEEARRGPRRHAPGLREVPPDSDLGHEFRRGHALHRAEARGASSRRTGTCCRRAPGGTSFVLSAMGGMLHSMVDVTIAYRERERRRCGTCAAAAWGR